MNKPGFSMGTPPLVPLDYNGWPLVPPRRKSHRGSFFSIFVSFYVLSVQTHSTSFLFLGDAFHSMSEAEDSIFSLPAPLRDDPNADPLGWPWTEIIDSPFPLRSFFSPPPSRFICQRKWGTPLSASPLDRKRPFFF